ncbi:hypothetical protein [Thermomonospora sp. CIF 1]|uniref:hypothetical protein n=1 Tax=Thermomonospora sp. CIF 1 TaxID=1916083 RepID=UPI00257E3CAA|nr:hypothetical protein [Thermomonospora sp. CIF 1]
MVLTDELGGGATCNKAVGPNKGANAIHDIVGKGKKVKLDLLNVQTQPDYYRR